MSLITPGTQRHLVLLALRAGPCSREVLMARLGYGTERAIGELIRDGLAAGNGSHKDVEYHITETGKAVCPLRRDIPLKPLFASKH